MIEGGERKSHNKILIKRRKKRGGKSAPLTNSKALKRGREKKKDADTEREKPMRDLTGKKKATS